MLQTSVFELTAENARLNASHDDLQERLAASKALRTASEVRTPACSLANKLFVVDRCRVDRCACAGFGRLNCL